MQHLPKIAIVGRPNVGKSALFNCMIKKRLSIVDEEEGVTRDRVYGIGDCFGRPFEAIDTGGMLSNEPLFGSEITRQAEIAIEEADAIIQVVDGTVGPQALDLEVAKILRRTKKPVVLAVNKMDNTQQIERIHAFGCLGLHPIVATSATHRYQIAELLEALNLPEPKEEAVTSTAPKIAIIGRPNVGKSMLLNAVLGSERCIVSSVPGTTRDSIDTTVIKNETTYTMIDTAGIKRKPKEKAVVEKFATIRTDQAIERADVCLLVVDCQMGITSEEKRIARSIEQAEKGCVVALNKWDLVHNVRMEHALKGVEHEVPFLAHCPRLCISAKSGRNVDALFPLIDTVNESMSRRVPTHKLNKALMEWMQHTHPPMIGGKRLRIYYMAQVDTHPPKFVLFVNAPHLMEEGYRRYLINQLRETFQFEGVPFILNLKGKAKGRSPRQNHVHTDHAHTDQDLSALAAVIEDLSPDRDDSDTSLD